MHEVLPKLIALAGSAKDVEICGIVGSDGEIYSISNVAKNPKVCFTFDKKEYFSTIKLLQNKGEKVAFVYHSHPNGSPSPSKADKDYTAKSGVPQIIVCGDGKYEVLRRA